MTSVFTKASVLGLNAVLLESPRAVTEPPFIEETPSVIIKGINHKTVLAPSPSKKKKI